MSTTPLIGLIALLIAGAVLGIWLIMRKSDREDW